MTMVETRVSHRPLLGILFMCGSGTVFPMMNGLVQVLSERYPSEMIVWARTAAHLLFVLALFAPRLGLVQVLVTRRPGTQLARSLCLVASTMCFFTAVKDLPLAKAASISFTSPFIVTLLAWPMLGERFGVHRLAAVIAGFVGVLVVIRPGSEVFQWVSLLIVASATFYALYQILTRRAAGDDRAETSAIYSALVGTLVMSMVVPFFWVAPVTTTDALLLCSLGVLGGLGHYCVAKAMSYAPANVVSPFMYWQMVGSVIVGYLITDKLPDAYTWTGAAIIVGAGLYLGWRETRTQKASGPPAA